MQIAICEDNKNEQDILKRNIQDWASTRKINVDIFCYQRGEEFLFEWIYVTVDIIFLDIKMNGTNGIKLAEKIRKIDKNVLIVFVTNYRQYSLKGYDVNALHYIVKPLESPSSKLISVLDKAYDIWCSREKDIIIVSNDYGQIKLVCGNIYFIKMNSHIAELHTEKDLYETRKTAKELLELLPHHFIRCHRSHIVNLLKIDCVYKDYLLLTNGEKLPISRNNSKHVKDAFVHFYKG